MTIDLLELFKRHGSKVVIFSKKDYDKMNKLLKKFPAARKALQKLNIYLTPMDIVPNHPRRKRKSKSKRESARTLSERDYDPHICGDWLPERQ